MLLQEYKMESNNSIVSGFDSDKDDSLKITLCKIPGVQNGCMIILEGYIDTYNSSFFQKQMTKVIGAGFFNLLFDCKRLSYVSSTGLGSFTILLKMVKVKGGDIVLSEVQEKVVEVFQILGFSQFFNLKETTEEALEFLRDGGGKSMGTVFPKLFPCPSCGRSLQAAHAGRFRCTNCKAILTIKADGSVVLG